MRNDSEEQMTPDLPPAVEVPEVEGAPGDRPEKERPPDPEHGPGNDTATGEPPD